MRDFFISRQKLNSPYHRNIDFPKLKALEEIELFFNETLSTNMRFNINPHTKQVWFDEFEYRNEIIPFNYNANTEIYNTGLE